MFDPHDFDDVGYPEPPYPDRPLPLWKFGLILLVPALIALGVAVLVSL